MRPKESTAVATLKKSMNATSSHNLFYPGPTFSRPTSLAYSYDDTSMGLNVSNHNHNLLSSNSSYLPNAFASDGQNYRRQKSQPVPEQTKSIDLASTPSGKEIIVPTKKSIRTAPTRKKIKKIRQTNSFRNSSKSMPPQQSNPPSQKQVAINPFRQEDEDDVLAQKTHNSRRWSHVFPQGEIEFKRHAPPNWKSLCQPAILPITIDHFPSLDDLLDEDKYYFTPSEVNLDAMDKTYYANRSDLVIEMVRQRIVQDFQLVPQSVLAQSRREASNNYNGKINKDSKERSRYKDSKLYRTLMSILSSNSGKIQHTLSMGHRIHVISSNPSSKSVEFLEIESKNANNRKFGPSVYEYNLWMPLKKRYEKVTQKFQRFPEEYPVSDIEVAFCSKTYALILNFALFFTN